MNILILGGTAEARALALELDGRGHLFESSLAGRVARPRLPVGPVRIGGFGGVEGLNDYIAARQVHAIVDATHPFALTMSRHAVQAAQQSGIDLLRLERPGWSGRPGADGWWWVDNHGQAATVTAAASNRPFLTVGRQALDQFTGPLATAAALVRVVDEPEIDLPSNWTVLTSRGPYSYASERALILNHGADAIVTKDSGGDFTWSKIAIADELGIPVVMVRRAPYPAAATTVNSVSDAIDWVEARSVRSTPARHR